MTKLFFPIFLLFIIGMISCKSSSKGLKSESNNKVENINSISAALPVVCIYKTKKDYSNLVPVIMDNNKERIVSYPHPNDLKYGNSLRLPVPLKQGYWLDNKGINKNVAFLKYTYEEYSKMKRAPSIEELNEAIIDKNPLTDFQTLGKRNEYSDVVKEVNEWIEKNKTIVFELNK